MPTHKFRYFNKASNKYLKNVSYIDFKYCEVRITNTSDISQPKLTGQLVAVTFDSGKVLALNMYDLVEELSTNQFDKNEIEIFEGDILLVPGGWSGYSQGKEHLSSVEYKFENRISGLYFNCDDDITWEYCMVVGNVNENPTMIDYENAIQELNKKFPNRRIIL